MAVILALGTDDPEASRTVPWMDPVCAKAVEASDAPARSNKTRPSDFGTRVPFQRGVRFLDYIGSTDE